MIVPAKQRGEAPPTWLWITALIAIAAFAALVMYLDYHQKRDGNSHAKLDVKPGQDRAANAENATKGKNLPGDGNKFDFYQLLPDLESIVGENETDKVKTAPPTKAPQVSQDNNAPIHDKVKPPKVAMPNSAEANPPSAPPLAAKSATASQNKETLEYYLQVGAYKQYQTADRMKANLAMLGLKASIQRVDIGSVGRVHRVRLGPYDNIRDMRRIQRKLKAGNISSIMVRSKVPH